jgi:hypothetical protein
MFPLLRPKNEKDLSEKLLGKRKKFRLLRNGAALAVSGRLLAFYRREDDLEGIMPPAAGRVELLAVILTQAGRFFVYYIVTYPETEDIAGRQEYAHVCGDLDTVRAFLGAMHYPNRTDFVDAVLARTAKTLGQVAGVKPPASKPSDMSPETASGPIDAAGSQGG